MRLPPSVRRACEGAKLDFREGVHAASHAVLNVLPLYLVCNSSDVGTEVRRAVVLGSLCLVPVTGWPVCAA
jgi:ATP-dependent helicase YprA (DUF1998 family)